MHGTTMMFLFAVPVMEGVQIYLIPLMVGHPRDGVPAAERLQLLHVPVRRAVPVGRAFVLNFGPDIGWFSYVPLAGPQYGIGKRADVWAQIVTFTEVAALGGRGDAWSRRSSSSARRG